jgi:HrpA-like RNA helicase
LRSELETLVKSHATYQKMYRVREKLPSFKFRASIAEALERHQVEPLLCSCLAKRNHSRSAFPFCSSVLGISHMCPLQKKVVVISGETGCGKTTQIPQFILEDEIMAHRGGHCRIICTQPRRLSAVAVAERVANERVCRVGGLVGYSIRLENK